MAEKFYNHILSSILDRKTGVCTSLPMLYICVAERLNYPVYAVSAPNHVFCRYVTGDMYDRKNGYINIEATGGGGLNPDVFYIDDLKIPIDSYKNGVYLRTLTKKDTLVIITENEPNDSIIAKIEYLYDKEGIFVVLFNIKRLQFNILKHKLVPPIHILDELEKKMFMKQYNINNISKIPEIGRFDPQAQAVLLRPGDICRFERESITALKYYYYRVCV